MSLIQPPIRGNEHPMNAERGGVRFTLAHELCHILFDREKARSFVHASTPWAEPAVEQRANAFAAMLLMPLDRIDLDQSPKDIEALRLKVNKLTKQLEVGRTALIHHLANLDEISASARELLLARH